MTALAPHLLSLIETGGPIPVSTYMAECLLHPTYGYYSTKDPLGEAGDFTTAPEMSQMFGELIGLCLGQAWVDQGKPAKPLLTELGPGRGTLMSDALRALTIMPEFAPRLHLIEASAVLRQEQMERLRHYEPTWHASVTDLPRDRPLFLIANEFFDALPIRQYQRRETGWDEIMVAAKHNNKLCQIRVPCVPPKALSTRSDVQPGQIVELCPAFASIMSEIEDRLTRNGGAVVIIDYGGWRSLGDTVQAVRDHKSESIFANPGEADLTAHVDFEALSNHAPNLKRSGMTPQGIFLERLGITARAQQLAKTMQGDALENHIAAHRRLTHPKEMGSLFKVLAFVPKDAPLPPGFENTL